MSDFLKRALLVAALATTQVQADDNHTNTNGTAGTAGTAIGGARGIATAVNVARDRAAYDEGEKVVSGAIINTAAPGDFIPPALAEVGPVCIETGILFTETFCSSSEIGFVNERVVGNHGPNTLAFQQIPVLKTTICRFGATGGECQISTVPIDLRHLAP